MAENTSTTQPIPRRGNDFFCFLSYVGPYKYYLLAAVIGNIVNFEFPLLIAEATGHLMLVAAGLDSYGSEFNRGYEPLLGENGDLWIIENAGHVGGLAANPDVYSARMIDFFDVALRQ